MRSIRIQSAPPITWMEVWSCFLFSLYLLTQLVVPITLGCNVLRAGALLFSFASLPLELVCSGLQSSQLVADTAAFVLHGSFGN